MEIRIVISDDGTFPYPLIVLAASEYRYEKLGYLYEKDGNLDDILHDFLDIQEEWYKK